MLKNKKILIIIPARGGSKGIKLKNLKKINGKTLIQITIEFAKSLNFVDHIVVNSDHKKILETGRKMKVNSMIRPNRLSGDFISDYQIIENTIYNLKKSINKNFDILIYLQPTSPFRKKSQITKSLNELIDNNLNSIWSVSKVEKKFHPKKIITCTKKNYFKLFDKSGEKVVARQQLDNTYIRNGLFYIFKIKKLIEKKSIYLNKSKISITNYHVINIDNQIDLRNAKKFRF